MSLGIAFKGPEGIVLAADSRVTLNVLRDDGKGHKTILPSTFDHATKLLTVRNQQHIAAITFGLGALQTPDGPRTAHSFIPEFEEYLNAKAVASGPLSTADFAQQLSDFFLDQHKRQANVAPNSVDMVFLVGGYDPRGTYGRLFEFLIPSRPTPAEQHAGSFGAIWGGQRQIVDRLLNGADDALFIELAKELQLDPQRAAAVQQKLRSTIGLPIPYAFLPLQDTVDLATLLIRTTISAQRWMLDVRGVGGEIDVVTITRTNGVQAVQTKKIKGERS